MASEVTASIQTVVPSSPKQGRWLPLRALCPGFVTPVPRCGSVRGRAALSKRGSSRLRRALYFPAMTALRFNPLVRALRDRLKERVKAKMAVLGAAMRKLLHIIFGVLKSGRPFDPNFAPARA